ncbi:aspartyl aminopeptidase [Caldanaerobacter subterraneus subsp. tengcongensis MB4]|uniref:M18 family aminopeptidase n=1 Tax=Caldanaerobacter subterraneus subsp. tengcongensis (strain DSM 15242 / JCM 11007 / NBRC 100824 / MB4) TaxID=273068 RepID=Q8R9D5_CALS4|nr:aminopeptidase [Caldanaerobacter subterraneus]AAM24881.1 Aspartyl aminopeptidase [Caldanaerobacter subterraneus subsp. tengcongensis MB4]MCS3915548.1 aspartyl aminopeptidase [Caldanaerobacter subterraneus subsp. tengcongensis MB4]
MEEKDLKEIEKRLGYKNVDAWTKISSEEREKVFEFAEGYKEFMAECKTERETAEKIIKIAEEHGFIDIEKATNLKPGSKVYYNNKGKSVVLAVIGKESMQKGIKAVASHIDSPRIDLKPNPLYEEGGLALFKTHYYGGIKKYQWVTIPLALHGVIVKSNGEKINIVVGEDENDPVLYITDLLPHLGKDQMEKKASEVVTGEALNAVVGSIPLSEEVSVKPSILKYLNEKYGIVEEDLLSAELELVPAYKPRDVGFDRSMIAAYGQDDRVSAYTSLKAILEIGVPERTAVAIFADKEEVGSMGNTGLQSRFFENAIAEILEKYEGSTDIKLRRLMANSEMLSADVNAAFDPTYAEVSEKQNTAYFGKGVCITKYTGVRGKAGSNDANAEFVGKVRRLFNENGVIWQMEELGKVDMGGGGTVAQYAANYGMEVLDCGVALLSMHAPYELSSKVDVYMAYKAYKVFMEKD